MRISIRSAREATEQGRRVSARNRELFGLIPASLLVTAGFAGVFIQRSNALSNVSLTYGAIFLGLCLAAHVFIRITLPHADPYMFPLVAVLASFGLVMVYRIDPTLARQQAQWFVLGLILFAATIIAVSRLPQARALPLHDRGRRRSGCSAPARCPGSATQANGAYLGVRIPGVFVFQPAEFAKIGLVIFLASYLRDTRQVLVQGARRFLGSDHPAAQAVRPGARDLGPGDGDPGRAQRHRLLDHVLRRSARDAVRRDQSGVVRGHRSDRRGHRVLVPGHAYPAHPRPRGDVAASAQPAAL